MGSHSCILTIDRNQRNLELLAQFLGKEGYETVSVSALESLEQILEHPENIGIALIDISGFDRNIWAYCEKLTELGVPLLVISPQKLINIRQESISHGAHGVLFKPLVTRELTTIIRTLMGDVSHE